MNEKVISSNNIENQPIMVKKEPQSPEESQKSPSASSSASDTASSASSSHFSQLIGLPAPVPIKPPGILNLAPNPNQIPVKCEATEVEEEGNTVEIPTDLTMKLMASEKLKSAFCSIPTAMEEKINEFQKKIEDDHKIHMQVIRVLISDKNFFAGK